MRLLLVALLTVALAMASCVDDGTDMGECPDPHVLAAGSHLALSCEDPGYIYEGTAYQADCKKIHPSRLGEPIEVDTDGAVEGARQILGVPISDAFVLLWEGRCRNGWGLVVESGQGLSTRQIELLRSPRG